MKAFFKFEIINKDVPDVLKRGVRIIQEQKDSNLGGIKNTYKVFKVYCISIFGKSIAIYKQYLGNATFLRPYKSIWDKKRNRVPKVYWGNDPKLMNLWILLHNDYDKLPKTILSDITTQSETLKLFGVTFESKILKKSLKLNKTFSLIIKK